MSKALDFTGRVVLVTGGTRGIGAGIAACFLHAGAEVVVCGRKAPDILPTGGGRTASYLPANVRDPSSVAALFSVLDERHGRLDVLVNNAGGSPPAPAATASHRFHAAIIDLNLTAPLLVAQHANRMMQAQGQGGAIVNIASVSGTLPSPGTAAYGAAKAGLINLTGSLAVEWAPKVRVNAIVAGLIRTEQAEQHYGDEAGIEAVGATVPLGRMGTPEEVGDMCLLLASPLAAYTSGACVALHGGGERPAFLDAAESGGS